MPTTSNFGWTTPADTDLVKDGAAAIRTLGNGIDTSFLDLKGGTTGQVLSKASNTDLDFSWIAQDDADAIQKSLIDAEGDLIVGDAADAVQRLAIGSNGNVLTVDTAVDGKIKWAAPAATGFVGCRVSDSTNPSIGNGVYTLITWNTETFDTDGFHSTVTNTGRITIPSGKNGYYKVTGTINWASNNTGSRIIVIYKNGVAAHYSYTAPGVVSNVIATTMSLVATDYIEIYAYQGSGGNLTLYSTGDFSWFEVNYLGA